MELPKIGDIIDNEKAIELCDHFNLDHLSDRIKKNPEQYRSWEFDGCSMIPDEILGIFTKSKRWEDITMMCCLPHDLGYAYGDPDNEEEERELVDKKFETDLKKIIRWWGIAKLFFFGVRIGGPGWMNQSFSWAYARV